ncbi:zona pellucida sperm-binding protein 3-like isoform X2 [Astyanax mexicanus]|uniref:Zona pellucida sperm-binding protein 3-like isoform X2 n=1 Tax=Astyanax mexicanus TaxID=7994 RepID=A0A8T2LXK4_ASTMX|nr:zona pellucida sperm-binding protein 3-like isoform X2 [Astyanax mexicanus]
MKAFLINSASLRQIFSPTLRVISAGLQNCGSESQIFISCHLRATPHHSPPDCQNKACYFHWPSISWHSAEGNNTVCSCCETGDCTAGKTDMPSKYLQELTTVDALPLKPLWTGKLVT